jgi:hypothetical protein
MEPMGNVSRIQRREKNSSSNTNNNRFKRELASAKQELVSLKERSWKYGCLLLIALFFAISLVGYIVIDKYDIINVVGVSGSGGIGSNTATNKNSAASKAGVFIVVEEVDVSHKSGEQDENETQIEIQTETTTAAVANDNDAEKNKNKNKNSDDNNNNNDDNNKKDNVVKDDNDEQSTSPVPPSKNENGSKSISIIKQKQIENYRNGTALMLNVHMVHHGGTYTAQYSSCIVFTLRYVTLRYVPRSANFICLFYVVSDYFILFFLTFINFLSTQRNTRYAQQVQHFVKQ